MQASMLHFGISTILTDQLIINDVDKRWMIYESGLEKGEKTTISAPKL